MVRGIEGLKFMAALPPLGAKYAKRPNFQQSPTNDNKKLTKCVVTMSMKPSEAEVVNENQYSLSVI